VSSATTTPPCVHNLQLHLKEVTWLDLVIAMQCCRGYGILHVGCSPSTFDSTNVKSIRASCKALNHGTMLMSMVLVGKSFIMHDMPEDGCSRKPDFDSHASDQQGTQIVIFEDTQVMPLYRVTVSGAVVIGSGAIGSGVAGLGAAVLRGTGYVGTVVTGVGLRVAELGVTCSLIALASLISQDLGMEATDGMIVGLLAVPMFKITGLRGKGLGATAAAAAAVVASAALRSSLIKK